MLSGLAIDTIAKSGMNRHRPICAIWVVTRLKIVPMSTNVDEGRFFFIILPILGENILQIKGAGKK